MTTLIKLTLANNKIDEKGKMGQTILINAGCILQAAKNDCIKDTTIVELPDRMLLVRETIDEIYDAVWQEEHPFHQQKINVTDEVLAELKNAKPTLQVLPDESSISCP